MTDKHSFRGLLHRATHRIPGISAHAERPVGHQGRARHGRVRRRCVASHPSPNHGQHHSAAHPPRVMVAWQSRIAAFFGQELR